MFDVANVVNMADTGWHNTVYKQATRLKNLKPLRTGDSDLFIAMKQIAETGKGPQDQIPSAGCAVKWKYD